MAKQCVRIAICDDPKKERDTEKNLLSKYMDLHDYVFIILLKTRLYQNRKNALENAVAGCLTIPKGRHIDIVAEADAELMSIMIQNSFDGRVHTVSDKIFSRKRKHRVGVGLESMRTICEKNHGSMKAEWKENTFTVLFVLSLQSNT